MWFLLLVGSGRVERAAGRPKVYEEMRPRTRWCIRDPNIRAGARDPDRACPTARA